MINKKKAKLYCCEDISKIENYHSAVLDKTQTWDCHHRAEVLPCGRYSMNDLQKHGLYWKVPASQLIFLTQSEHLSLHNKGKHLSPEHRKKIADSNTGKHHSEETKKKISYAKSGENNPLFGTHHSEETKKKISYAKMGHEVSEETRMKISKSKNGRPISAEHRRRLLEANIGRSCSDETKRKISEARKRYWEKRRAAK